MSNSPNKRLRSQKLKPFNYYAHGNNQLFRKYRTAFEILLTREYYEGTEFGTYYNTFVKDDEGGIKSEIYIRQPNIERLIKNEIIENNSDMFKYLVGYMGVGKTTLIRNMFNVFNRKTSEFNDNLVIYISFFAMASEDNEPIESIRTVIKGALDSAITYLSGYKTRAERIAHEDDEYYINFYAFIEDNNPTFAASIDDSKLLDEMKKADCFEKEYVNELYNRAPIDSLMTLMKYYLSQENNSRFSNVIIIFDDLETQPIECIKEVLKLGAHINKCLKGLGYRHYRVKQIVSLRSYTFRQCDCRRSFGALRIESSDVIIKNEVPSLTQIIKARMKVISKKLEKKSFNPSITAKLDNRLDNAYDNLEFVLNTTYGQYDKMLLNLTHYNLFNAMKLLIRIVSNNRYVGKKEKEKKGSFKVDINNYDLKNKSENSANPGNNDVFFALVYGSDNIYIDSKDYYLMNILHYHSDEKVNTELLGIYIIQYLIKHGIYINWETVDSTSTPKQSKAYIDYKSFEPVESVALVNELSRLYDRADSISYNSILMGFELMIKHLYNGGALLQDIAYPVLDDDTELGRNYEHKEGVRVYLSLRGKQLYEMLKYNSLLLEVYRDDIDTNLENNEKSTVSLYVIDRIKYCLDYVEHIHNREQMLMSLVGNKKGYIENLGSELAVVVLMKGIRQSIITYFSDATEKRALIVGKYNQIAGKINKSIRLINENNDTSFKSIAFIKQSSKEV